MQTVNFDLGNILQQNDIGSSSISTGETQQDFDSSFNTTLDELGITLDDSIHSEKERSPKSLKKNLMISQERVSFLDTVQFYLKLLF